MTKRARGGSRGGRSGERGGHGCGRGQNYTGARTVAKSGLCAVFGSNVFDYGHRAAADQMRTSWEKLIQFVGTNYGQDNCNELQNKISVVLSEPVHTPEVLARHAIREQMVRTGEENLQRARLSKRIILEAAATLGTDPDAPMQLAILDNQITEGSYKQNNEVPIEMLDSEKMQYSNDWRTYRERNALLTKHRGQAFSLILSQCTQLLQDRMKQDTDWNMTSTSYNSFQQETMSNPQWYEKFNTKVDVGLAISVT
jgi:hypothetical protein